MGKFSEALASGRDNISAALKPIKFVASATIGIPVALAASAVMLCLAAIVKGMDLCWSVVSKSSKSVFQTELYYEPFLHDLSSWMWGKTISLWKDYGAYAHIAMAQWATNSMSKISSHYGLNRDSTENAGVNHTDRFELDKLLQKEQEKLEMQQNKKIKDKKEFQEGLNALFDTQAQKEEFLRKQNKANMNNRPASATNLADASNLVEASHAANHVKPEFSRGG